MNIFILKLPYVHYCAVTEQQQIIGQEETTDQGIDNKTVPMRSMLNKKNCTLLLLILLITTGSIFGSIYSGLFLLTSKIDINHIEKNNVRRNVVL